MMEEISSRSPAAITDAHKKLQKRIRQDWKQFKNSKKRCECTLFVPAAHFAQFVRDISPITRKQWDASFVSDDPIEETFEPTLCSLRSGNYWWWRHDVTNKSFSVFVGRKRYWIRELAERMCFVQSTEPEESLRFIETSAKSNHNRIYTWWQCTYCIDNADSNAPDQLLCSRCCNARFWKCNECAEGQLENASVCRNCGTKK